jgi:hypothetical protein
MKDVGINSGNKDGSSKKLNHITDLKTKKGSIEDNKAETDKME